MTDLRKAALDFLRLAIEDPKDHGHYAVDSNGEVYWYKEKPEAKHNEDRWMPGYGIPHKKQKIPHWDSLVFSAEEVASTPAEPPQPEIAPSPKMGPFNIERFKAGEFAYGKSISGNCLNYRYLGELLSKVNIACAVSTPCDLEHERLVSKTISELERDTKMPVKTEKLWICVWIQDDGFIYATSANFSPRESIGDSIRVGPRKARLIEIIEREIEI